MTTRPATESDQRILVVEDEPDIQELLRINLTQAGFTVNCVDNGADALRSARELSPDLVILDLMLPDQSGTDVCRELRADTQLAGVPIVMVTARTEEVDRVVGFELGADDYVTKPFSPRELVLRVKAVLRRGTDPAPQDTHSEDQLEFAGLRLDLGRHRCSVNDQEVVLTAKEFALLRELMSRRGRVMSREALVDQVWGSDISVTLRTVDTHLKRLREKLGASGDAIETVRGVGYRFAD